ncbi:MAG: ATP-binding protein, partial [Candidatus Altiarchaeota archaeon]|nr:ATP-binding protein [Candidatus Altiarchaeota archaeon]
RDNLHILLIGDPGTAKSQILKYVDRLAPKSIYVSGKSATGGGLCVHGDTLIQLSDGSLSKIRDVVENNFNEPSEVKEGMIKSDFGEDATFAINGSLKIEKSRLDSLWKIEPPRHLYSLTTGSGNGIKLTPGTKLMTIDHGEVIWRKACDLKPGEYVATFRSLPAGTKEETLLELLDMPNLYVSLKPKIVEKLIRSCEACFGSLRKAAVGLGTDENNLYHFWKQSRSIRLPVLKKLQAVSGVPWLEISKNVESCMIRDGKRFRLPISLNDKGLAYLLGVIAGDGSIYRRGGSAMVRIYSSDKEFLKQLVDIVSELFGTKTPMLEEKGKVPYIRIDLLALAEICNLCGIPHGKKSDRISLTSHITSLPNESLASVIQGLYDSEANVHLDRTRIEFLTCSDMLSKQLGLLLRRFGIMSKIATRDKRGHVSHIGGREVVVRDLQYRLTIQGLDNIKRFHSSISFRDADKRRRLERLLDRFQQGNTNIDIVPNIDPLLHGMDLPRKYYSLYMDGKRMPSVEKLREISSIMPDGGKTSKEVIEDLANSDVFWDRISEIGLIDVLESGIDIVYDVTVKGNHNFMGNGFVVHNTAIAEKEEFGEGGWVLKAGALVLAAGGLAAIDEFDKMSEEDRSAIHEALEQQTVSVAKAGIIATFKANSAVLAAANPKYSRFDPYKPPAEQFNIPPTLISRFDLIFPIKDVLDEQKDRNLADHILSAHKLSQAPDRKGPEFDAIRERLMAPIDETLLRKYIAYTKKNIRSVLTDEAMVRLREYYVNLRKRGSKGSVPLTPRQLEGLVRLSEASAKLRLSKKVELQDAERAIRLVEFVLTEVGMEEGGTFDIDRIMTDHPRSERDKIYTVTNIVKGLEEEFEMVPMQRVLDEAREYYNIDNRTAEKLIQELLTKGDLYEPRHGHLKTVSR